MFVRNAVLFTTYLKNRLNAVSCIYIYEREFPYELELHPGEILA